VTDKELTLRAAKACGMELAKPGDHWGWSWFDWLNGLGRVTGAQGTVNIKPGEWRPLEDDGDALRLAVKLGLLVYVMLDAGFTAIRLPGEHIGGKYDEVQTHNGDPYAATRRAIVRAAAAIGEAMP
jgi:hypothetical protein